jgi:hypothetical protein
MCGSPKKRRYLQEQVRLHAPGGSICQRYKNKNKCFFIHQVAAYAKAINSSYFENQYQAREATGPGHGCN